MHALKMLKPGGRLVAICANGPTQNDTLRPVVEAHGGIWEELTLDTFISTGTSFRTVLLMLDGFSDVALQHRIQLLEEEKKSLTQLVMELLCKNQSLERLNRVER
jgi:hypothetical protein